MPRILEDEQYIADVYDSVPARHWSEKGETLKT